MDMFFGALLSALTRVILGVLIGIAFGAMIAFATGNVNINSMSQNEYPPDGYAIDYMLMNMDDIHGISKAEKNRRIKSGYYLKPCDKFHCIDKKIMGRPLE